MKGKLFAAFLLVSLILLAVPAAVSAHGHTDVGDYEIVIGFHNEPTYQGEPNGLDLFVTNMKTGEAVNGLEETLKAEIIFGGQTKELPVEAQWGVDGAYTAYLIPTAVGDYTWHIFGEIEGTPVDVSMTSSPDTFESVESKDSVAFPADSASAGGGSQTTLVLAILGSVLGLAGLVLGALGLQAARKRSG